LDNLLKFSRREVSTRRERKPAQRVPTVSTGSSRSKENLAHERQYKVGITNLPKSEAQRIRKEREVAFKIEDSKLRQLLEGAYDMTKEEREAKPMKGTLFNWVFVQTLPEDLIQFYVDHPDLEVERWKKFSTNPYDSFVSFAYGQVCYTVDGNRAFMYASSIVEHYRRDNLRGDPRAFTKFAMLRWPDIQRDIEITAMLGGYRKPLPART